MRILYDSKQLQYKTPFGPLATNEKCTLTIRVPSTVQATMVSCIINRDAGSQFHGFEPDIIRLQAEFFDLFLIIQFRREPLRVIQDAADADCHQLHGGAGFKTLGAVDPLGIGVGFAIFVQGDEVGSSGDDSFRIPQVGLPEILQQVRRVQYVVIHGDNEIFRVFPEGIDIFLMRLQIPGDPADLKLIFFGRAEKGFGEVRFLLRELVFGK